MVNRSLDEVVGDSENHTPPGEDALVLLHQRMQSHSTRASRRIPALFRPPFHGSLKSRHCGSATRLNASFRAWKKRIGILREARAQNDRIGVIVNETAVTQHHMWLLASDLSC